jgi:hypothetical protein
MDAMFERWCAREERLEAAVARRLLADPVLLDIVGSPYVRDGEAYILADDFRPPCSCAGGSPRAEPESRLHEPTCALRIFNEAPERQRAASVRRYRERHGLDGTETPLFSVQRQMIEGIFSTPEEFHADIMSRLDNLPPLPNLIDTEPDKK